MGRANKWVMGKKAMEKGERREAHLPFLSQRTLERGEGEGRARKEGNPANGPMHGRPTSGRSRSLSRSQKSAADTRSDGRSGIGWGPGRPLPILETLCCDLRVRAWPWSRAWDMGGQPSSQPMCRRYHFSLRFLLKQHTLTQILIHIPKHA